jgi:DNA invertase Pin-like site-specific DNA recombinase
MKAAIYCRVSTDEQNDDLATSLDEQERACREFAEGNGWEVVAVYRDDFTGTRWDRPEWMRLLADAMDDRPDAVVCKQRDRFQRDADVGAKMRGQLTRLGVRLFFIDTGEVRFKDADDRFMTRVLDALPEHNKAKMQAQLAADAHGKARDGRWPGGPQSAPFGLMVVYEGDDPRAMRRSARLDLNPAEVAVIEEAARLMVDEGKTITQAVASLNDHGLLPRYGKRWTARLLHWMLSRPSLYGHVVWGADDKK